jgi:hypothetical protein
MFIGHLGRNPVLLKLILNSAVENPAFFYFLIITLFCVALVVGEGAVNFFQHKNLMSLGRE